MIILTSSVASVAEHMYKNYLFQKDYKTILFIDTAAEPEIGHIKGDDDWLRADLESLRNQGYQVDRWSITNKNHEQIKDQIDNYDVIYMCGGNTVYLLQQLQKTNSFNLIVDQVKSGKPYIGTSAGSIIAGLKIPTYLEDPGDIELNNYNGFGFINFIIVPHWGSESFKKMYLDERLELAYTKTEPPFLLMSDYHYLIVGENNEIRIINTKE